MRYRIYVPAIMVVLGAGSVIAAHRFDDRARPIRRAAFATARHEVARPKEHPVGFDVCAGAAMGQARKGAEMPCVAGAPACDWSRVAWIVGGTIAGWAVIGASFDGPVLLPHQEDEWTSLSIQ